ARAVGGGGASRVKFQAGALGEGLRGELVLLLEAKQAQRGVQRREVVPLEVLYQAKQGHHLVRDDELLVRRDAGVPPRRFLVALALSVCQESPVRFQPAVSTDDLEATARHAADGDRLEQPRAPGCRSPTPRAWPRPSRGEAGRVGIQLVAR